MGRPSSRVAPGFRAGWGLKQAAGYDGWSELQVAPGFRAGWGLKRGEPQRGEAQ